MHRPPLSWYPARFVRPALTSGWPTLEAWMAQAYSLGLAWVQVHVALLPSRAPEMVRQVRRRMERHGLGVSLLLCAPDLAHPDPTERAAAAQEVVRALGTARELGAVGVRVTPGRSHADVDRWDALGWCAEWLVRLSEQADRMGLVLALENRHRGRRLQADDFAQRSDEFAELCRRTRDSALRIQFNAASPLLVGEEPLLLLDAVVDRVWHVQLADRFPGHWEQTVLGEGAVDLDGVLGRLAETGFAGFIGIEDDNPRGDAGTEAGLKLIRRKLSRFWA